MVTEAASPRLERIRVSIGTAGLLRILRLHSNAEPTTAYLMTYTPIGCRANCAFCPQARESTSSKQLLSRVAWPDFPLNIVLEAIRPTVEEGKLRRVCVQALNYPRYSEDVSMIASAISSKTDVPISVSCPPMTRTEMERLKQVGVERIGLPLDGANREIFDRTKGALVKGPYRWEAHFKALNDALSIFGVNNVSTHIIVGLGETERDLVEIIQRLHDMGVNPSLFAFTPISGTRLGSLRRPGIGRYRRVQLARYLMLQGISSTRSMRFSSKGKILSFGVGSNVVDHLISIGDPFMTAGCPDCNRPFYNESPRGPIYNYPKPLGEEDKKNVAHELQR